uniref:WRKY transcription factor 55 n=1 Tax=Oryza sativa subsp. indica TaxID=39946 RepID=Q6IEM6_ORYSI|nr:TPA_inf: WRKY transcription factor 55 [Oryza sativa Indica Group]
MRKVDTFAPHNDGHQWRKYGEKKINNCNFPRTNDQCQLTFFKRSTA